MHRFFVDPDNISQNKIIIQDKATIHHLKDVLHLGINDEAIACDDKGNEFVCVIKEILKGQATLDIKTARRKPEKENNIKLTFACAIPKKAKMDEIIDKLTQLGVDRIIPLYTERVVVKLNKHKENLRLEKWKKTALVASQQSQRTRLPIIERPQTLERVLAGAQDSDLKLIPALIGRRKALKEVMLKSRPNNILVLIGPEGDFTDEEINIAEKSGCIPVTLGEQVLRVDTAAIAVAGFIQLFLKEI